MTTTVETRAVEIARMVLESRCQPLTAVRELSSLAFHLVRDPVADRDLVTFVAVASEVDGLPLGSERLHWSAEALVEKDVEIARATDLYRDALLKSCRRVVERWGAERI